jgi:hypothetical protein
MTGKQYKCKRVTRGTAMVPLSCGYSVFHMHPGNTYRRFFCSGAILVIIRVGMENG